jgi:hypothetical protein
MTLSRCIPLLALALTLGCASGPGRIQPPSAQGALLFGSLELPEQVASSIQWVIIYELGTVYAPPFKTPIKARVFPNGDFYMENVKPGSYFVHHAAAGWEAFYMYPPNIEKGKEAALANATEVAPGSLTFLGRYRVHDWKPGAQSRLSPQVASVRVMSSPPGTGPEPIPNFMDGKSAWAPGAGSFKMERTQRKADEKRVLSQILSEVTGSGWDARVEERLRALR